MAHETLTACLRAFFSDYHALCARHGLELCCVGRGNADLAVIPFSDHNGRAFTRAELAHAPVLAALEAPREP